MTAALRGEPIRVTDGRAGRDYVYVGDVVEACLAAATVPAAAGEVVNVGSGRLTTNRELVERLGGRLGPRARRPGRRVTSRVPGTPEPGSPTWPGPERCWPGVRRPISTPGSRSRSSGSPCACQSGGRPPERLHERPRGERRRPALPDRRGRTGAGPARVSVARRRRARVRAGARGRRLPGRLGRGGGRARRRRPAGARALAARERRPACRRPRRARRARGSWAAVLDGDLQDPPEAIPQLLAAGREQGVPVVFAGRRGRYESRARLLTSRALQADALPPRRRAPRTRGSSSSSSDRSSTGSSGCTRAGGRRSWP